MTKYIAVSSIVYHLGRNMGNIFIKLEAKLKQQLQNVNGKLSFISMLSFRSRLWEQQCS